MTSWRRSPFWRSLPRRLVAAVTLAAYLAAASGVPLPAAAPRDDDQPFPCQDSPCGCRTAEQCWASCCCYTPEQRLAWAREHNVEPPAYAEKPAPHGGWRTTRLRDRAEGKTARKSCGSCGSCDAAEKATHSPSCEHTCQPGTECPQSDPKPDVPEGGPSEDQSSPEPAPEGKGKGKVRWGFGLSPLQCQGERTLWVSLGAVLPTRPDSPLEPGLPCVGRVAFAANALSSLTVAPPEPPPRLRHV